MADTLHEETLWTADISFKADVETIPQPHLLDLPPDDKTTPKRHLLNLPQEIQDMIFELAYPEISDFQTVGWMAWERREDERRKHDRDNYTAQDFPQPKACEFLVSKRYFLAASKAFVANQVFHSNRNSQLISNSFGSLMKPGIAFHFLKSAVVAPLEIRHIEPFPPNLNSLEVSIGSYDLDCEPKLPWLDDLEEADLRKAMLRCGFHRLAGLRHFRLLPRHCYYANRVDQEDKWITNVEKFQEFATPYVRLPKEASGPRTDPFQHAITDPLYPGSKVSWNAASSDVGLNAVSSNSGIWNPASWRVASWNALSGLANWALVAKNCPKVEMPDIPEHDRCNDSPARLRLEEIPSNLGDFRSLLNENGERVMELIKELQDKDAKGLIW